MTPHEVYTGRPLKHLKKLFQPPSDPSRAYINFKGFFSIVLLAVANVNYRFFMCDCGGRAKIFGMQKPLNQVEGTTSMKNCISIIALAHEFSSTYMGDRYQN